MISAGRTVRRMINPRSDRPVYRQLADELRAEIDRLQPGDRLPSEAAISQRWGVGRETVRRALRVLRDEGLVETESGYGTRVRVQVERQRVRVPRGSMLVCRPATAAERADVALDLGEGEWVIEVWVGGRVAQIHPAGRVELDVR